MEWACPARPRPPAALTLWQCSAERWRTTAAALYLKRKMNIKWRVL